MKIQRGIIGLFGILVMTLMLAVSGKAAADSYTEGGGSVDGWYVRNYGISIGKYSETTKDYGISFGYDTHADGSYSTAIGYGSRASGTDGIALGTENTASGARGIAIGKYAQATMQDSIAIGSSNKLNDGTSAAGKFSVAIGSDAKAAADQALALGALAKAEGVNSPAVGGTNTEASGKNSSALGTDAQAKYEASTAVGYSAWAASKYATVLGAVNKANGQGSTAIGNGARADAQYSVALGAGSVASPRTISQQDVYLGYRQNVAGTIKGNTGVVSIGSIGNTAMGYEDLTRQLAGVAAGSADTDAVNVAQLKGLGEAVSDVIGGGVSFADGAWNGFTIGGTHYDTLVEAISALGGSGGDWTFSATNGDASAGSSVIETGGELTLNGGKNVAISKDGDHKYTVGVSDNPEFNSVKAGGKVEISGSGIKTGGTGIDMGGAKITNVGDGKISLNSTDAVNGGQLWDAYRRMGTMENNIYREIDGLREDVNIIGAHAAALSGLHPIDYNPYEPTTLSAAVGAYRDEYAVAVGVFHYVRENVMFNLGASLCSDGDLMGRTGVSFTIGRTPEKPQAPETLNGLRSQLTAIQAKLGELEAKNSTNEEIIRRNTEIMKKNEELIRELSARLEAEI